MLRRYLTLLVAVILLLFVPVAVSAPLRNAATRLVAPIGNAILSRSQGLRNSWLNLRELDTIRSDRTTLQQRVVSLEQQLIETENLRRENEALRKELGVTGVTHALPKVAGRVIVQGDNPLDYTLTIDVGSDQGVEVGQPAVAQGVLIGKVIAVRAQSSVVRTITSLESGIQAWLVINQEKGFVVGNGSGVVLQDISQGLDVPPGTIVETSGLGGSLPQGILIGEVDSLTSAKSTLSQTFRLKLPIDPLSVQSLFIILTDKS